MSDGMFLSACRQVAKEFPEIAYDEDLLDRACLQVRLIRLYRCIHDVLNIRLDYAKSSPIRRPRHGDA